ncbi:MAG: pyridoxamine 5'-phosphate oxidase family protein [Nitrospirota bacterium]
MERKEILAFMNANPAMHLATVEGNKPHVRGMLMYKADETGVIFHTGKMKDLHKQLTENPQVEMCFNNGNIQIRVSGTVELVENIELKKEIVQKREFLKPWVEQAGYELLAIYRMNKGVATVWTMETNFAPKEFFELW